MSTLNLRRSLALAAIAAGSITASAAGAATLNVKITNNQASGGLYLTPLVAIFHDGLFDPFDAGSAASAPVQAIAEFGNPAPLIAANPGRNIGVITSPGGFAGAPVIDPGETASLQFTVNEATERFFSFLSMVIPSNDIFIGNDNATAYEIFDSSGMFTGIGPISVLGGSVWDAGTAQNTNSGAAFNANGGTATVEGGVVSLAGDLSFLLGQPTVAGTVISSVPGSADLLATIEISTVSAVPVPASLPLLAAGLFGLGAAARRRARRA